MWQITTNIVKYSKSSPKFFHQAFEEYSINMTDILRTQSVFTYSKLTRQTLEQGVKYVQS